MAAWNGITQVDEGGKAPERHDKPGPLAALAENLLDQGLAASVVWFGTRQRVSVLNRSLREMQDSVYIAPDEDGTWWYWWSWGDKIGLISDPAQAAIAIAKVLMADA
jgi:hypothetical protein